MAAVVAVVKTAVAIDSQVKKRVPGGWVTIIATILVVVIASTMLIIQGVLGAVAPFFRNGDVQVCVANPSNNNSSGDDDHGDVGEDGSPGGGSAGETWSTAGTPFPTTDSTIIVYPAPQPNLSSPYGYRPPFYAGGALTPGYHNGLDFGQAMGSPVLSMADGVVAGAYAGNSLYGSHVAVKHKIKGSNYVTVYGHIQGASIKVKNGDIVKAGQQIASVGSEGMSTAPHIHFVLTRGDYVPSISEPGWNGDGPGNTIDPASFLTNQGAGEAGGGIKGDDFQNGAEDESGLVCGEGNDDSALGGDGFGSWGGHENGTIPDDVLKKIPFQSGDFRLLNVAADDLTAMSTAFKEEFMQDLYVVNAYRAKDQQEIPGKSIFGWARSVELKLVFNSPEYKWMTENASNYGWEQPAVYKKDGSSANAGLWGYVGKSDNGDAPLPATANAAENQKIAKSLMQQTYPTWGNGEMTCLIKLWERESNWNQFAENPAGKNAPEGGAYGIPQSLPGNKMATYGSDWRDNPTTQIKWGLNYIKERYTTPCGAWAHSEAKNWY